MPSHKALIALWLAAGSGAKRAENVVMLLADDLGWADVSVPPHKKAALWVTETPNLERMAREGLTLTGYRSARRLLAVAAARDGCLPLALPPQRPAEGRLPRPAARADDGAVLQSAGFAAAHFRMAPRRRAPPRGPGRGPVPPARGAAGAERAWLRRPSRPGRASVRDPPVCCSCCARIRGTTRRTLTEYRDPTDGPPHLSHVREHVQPPERGHVFAPAGEPAPKAMDLTKRTADEAVAWIRRQNNASSPTSGSTRLFP